jgi:AraC-like DNA-binding protein
MLRVLVQGMRDLGLNPEAGAPRSSGRAATVPLDAKRQLIHSALMQGGVGCLALLGRGLHRHAHEPTHQALMSARNVADLFTRWARLERYIHSCHRVELLASTACGARVLHMPRPGHPAPLPAESLVVLGVLVALIEAMGAAAVTARIGPVNVCPQPDTSALAAVVERGLTEEWFIGWAPFAASARPPSDVCRAPNPVAPQAWSALAQRCFSALCADLMQPLTLPALAHAQGEAPRSLQRKLRHAGLGYTELLAEARCSSASWWLIHTATPFAEVGLVSGYADQPHFTRDFKGRVGMTPQRYRTAFGALA